MAVRDDIRQALHDAIGWQEGLVDAWGADSECGKECLETIRRYKKILKRRYGHDRSPLDELAVEAKVVTLSELRAK